GLPEGLAEGALLLHPVDRLERPHGHLGGRPVLAVHLAGVVIEGLEAPLELLDVVALRAGLQLAVRDRKSTRLNSSHVKISYAVYLRFLPSFPTRRSSDLGLPEGLAEGALLLHPVDRLERPHGHLGGRPVLAVHLAGVVIEGLEAPLELLDVVALRAGLQLAV